MSIKPLFAWYDIWVGAFWDGKNRRLYVFPVPCIGLVVQFKQPHLVEVFRGVAYYPDPVTGKGQPPCNMVITVTTRGAPTAYVNKAAPST